MQKRCCSVDVIIPVYRPDEKLKRLLGKLQNQTHPVEKIIIMNTEKDYWDSSLEKQFGCLEIHHLKKSEFDHGATRNAGAACSEADIMVFMTQDAVPEDERLIEELIKPFLSDRQEENPALVVISYARQLPAPGCQIVERYTRSFNYPDTSRIKTKDDMEALGIKTFFASNACAAYRRELFVKLGGFIDHTIFNEDMIFAGKAVKAGYAVAYQADARVVHSHNYTCMQQFRRNFDLAVSQADHPEIFDGIRSETEGIKLVKKTASYLLGIKKPWLLLDLVMKSGFKLLGYRMGKMYRRLPDGVVRWCSMSKTYWKK